jgi:hypothetical protein
MAQRMTWLLDGSEDDLVSSEDGLLIGRLDGSVDK